MEAMNKVCRQLFVSLHFHLILENHNQDFSAKFSLTLTKHCLESKKQEHLFRNVPAKGDLDLEVVKNSIYFFS